jgi:hypothetical protein
MSELERMLRAPSLLVLVLVMVSPWWRGLLEQPDVVRDWLQSLPVIVFAAFHG